MRASRRRKAKLSARCRKSSPEATARRRRSTSRFWAARARSSRSTRRSSATTSRATSWSHSSAPTRSRRCPRRRRADAAGRGIQKGRCNRIGPFALRDKRAETHQSRRSNLEWAGGLASYDGDIHGFFQKVFLCSTDVAASIGRRARERRFPIDAVLLKQGDRAGATFLALVGRAHALTYSIAGHKVLLREFLPGDFFGAIVPAEPQPEEADVVAVEEVHAAVFL